MRKIFIYLSFIVFFLSPIINSQSMDWSSILIINPNPSPYLKDWEGNPALGSFTLNYMGTGYVNFKFRITFSSTKVGEVATALSTEREFLSGPMTQVFTNNEFVSFENVTLNNEFRDKVIRAGRFPEDNYQLCVDVINPENSVIYTTACAEFSVFYPDPPQLLLPQNGSNVTELFTTFVWNPVFLINNDPINYQIKVVEVLNNQTPLKAIQANIPLLETTISNTSLFVYPPDAYPLDEGKSYAWQLKAVDNDGEPIASNDGLSEIYTFTYKSLSGGGTITQELPDTLTLIPDFAFLSGVKNLSAIDNTTSFNLNGNCQIVIKYSETDIRVSDVSVNSLVLQKGAYGNPAILGGSVEGLWNSENLPEHLRNELIDVKKINWDLSQGLYLNANFKKPNSNDVIPLTGIVNLTREGLSGTLNYQGNLLNPIISLGNDLFTLNLSSVEFSFNGISLPEVKLNGGFKLFNSSEFYEVANLLLSEGLSFTYNLSYDDPISINLVQTSPQSGSGLIKLNLLSLVGIIEGNLGINNQGFSYNINSIGGVDLIEENFNIGVDVTLNLSSQNGFSLVSAKPRFNFQIPELDLSWMKLGIDNLNLNSLSYSGGNWDFDLKTNLIFRFPTFGDLKLPTLSDVSISKNGFSIPEINIPDISLPKINLSDYILDIKAIRLPSFNLDWGSLKSKNLTGFNFGFDLDFNMPNLPAGSSGGLSGINLRLPAFLSNGNFNFNLPDLSLPDLSLLVAGGIGFSVKGIEGSFNANLNPLNLSFNPNIKIRGNLSLPTIFNCQGGQTGISAYVSGIKLSGKGKLEGEISGFIPECPIKLGALSFAVSNSTLRFLLNESEQKIEMGGTGNINFSLAGNNPLQGAVTFKYEFIKNELTEFSGDINNPFVLNIPADIPSLSFNIASARVQLDGLLINGRQNLSFDGGVSLGVTFDNVKFNWNDLRISAGNVIFDSPFAFKAEIDNSNLRYSAVPIGGALTTTSGFMINLPETISLGKDGLKVNGDASASLKYNGFELPTLAVKYKESFAFNLNPFKVGSGYCELYSGNSRIALINSDGFFPELSFFANALLPAAIPLPHQNIAYIQIKENDNLLIDLQNNGDEYRLKTKAGHPVKIYFPMFKFNSPATPYLNIEFDITVDPSTMELKTGSLSSSIPEQMLADFDLSRFGIPLALKEFYYGALDGINQFRFNSKLKFFDKEISDNLVSVNITRDGRIVNDFNITFPGNGISSNIIGLVNNSDKLNLFINKIQGAFNTSLVPADIDFDFSLTSALKLKVKNGEYGASLKLRAANTGISIEDFSVDSTLEIPKIELPGIKLGLSGFTLPLLTYDKITGWDFEIGLDVSLELPDIGFTLPSIPNIKLLKTGLEFPQISIPEINIPAVSIAGFGIRPLAFRMPAGRLNIFEQNISFANDFAFDLELSLPNLPQNYPSELRNVNLSLLNAKFNKGILTGLIEPRNFVNPGIKIPFVNDAGYYIKSMTGKALIDSITGKQGFVLELAGDLQLPYLMRNAGNLGISQLNSKLGLTSDGFITGNISGFKPDAAIDLGIGKLKIVNSNLAFSFSTGEQKIVMDLSGSMKIPAPSANDSITAAGQLVIDFLNAEIIDGQLSINEAFKLNIPNESPLFSFAINNAFLNKDGLKINGNSNLLLPNNNSVGVSFNNLLFDYKSFEIKSGSADFNSDFSLKLIPDNGMLKWSSAKVNEIVNEASAIRINLPSGISLTNNGLSLNGLSSSFIRFNGIELPELGVDFIEQFKVGLNPIGVKTGKANFIQGGNIVAYLDKDGFHPGNIFGLIPIPEKLPLPDTTIAYLKLKDGGNLLVETESVTNGLRISTKPNEKIKLVLPSLKYNGSTVPEIETSFSIVISPLDFSLVSGNISISSPANLDNLIDLAGAGLPLKIKQIDFGKYNGVNRFRIGGEVTLPDAIGSLKIKLDSLDIGQNGLLGSINLGNYSTSFLSDKPYLAVASMGSIATIKLQGVSVNLGATNSIKFSGDILSDIFRKNNDTAGIHYSAEFSNGKFGFALDFSHLQNKIPLGLAEFIPMQIGQSNPVDLSFSADDFSLIFNGKLKIPSFGENFEVTIPGLKINKTSVTIPDLSITLPDNIQNFSLFGASFKIKDIGQNKAVSFSYSNKVLFANFSGELNFLGKLTDFSGLKIGTDGSVSLQSINLINSPISLIQDYVTLNNIGISAGKLAVTGSVKLPEPADTSKYPFSFKISPSGVIEGGSRITILDEAKGMGGNDNTEYDFWVAKFDPTYAGLNLNFADIEQSSLDFLADIYFMNDQSKYISFGNKSGNTINPGLQIGFNGEMNWGQIQTGGLTGIDWDVMRLKFDNIGTVPNSPNLTLSLSGSFGLSLDGLSGGINFTDLRLSKSGIDRLSQSITGGSLSISDVVSVTIDEIGYSSTPSSITIKGNSGGNSSDSTMTIDVLKYFKFGGSIDISGVASGGIDELLAYTTSNGNGLVIRNANLSIPNAVKFRVDLRYEKAGSNVSLLMGGAGEVIGKFGVKVLGKVAKKNGQTSFGAFVAVQTVIPVLPTVMITELGGGFFYNPEASDLATVRNLAGLSGTANSKITASPGKFAVLLYGAVSVVDKDLIRGKVLFTTTESYMTLHGNVTLLNQGNSIKGDFYLGVGFVNAFAEGDIKITLDFASLIKGEAGLSFFVYGANTWAIQGNMSAKIINILNAQSDFYVGPPGVILDVKIATGFDIWIVSVNAGFKGTFWYVKDISWGAFVKAYVKAEVLGGVVTAKGWLEGALIGSPQFFIYGVAGIKVSTFFYSWSGSVWASIKSSGFSGGFGRDPEMEKLIEEAKESAEQMNAAKDAAKNALDEAKLASLGLSDEQMRQAFNTLYKAGQLVRSDNNAAQILGVLIIASVIQNENSYGGSTPQETELYNYVVQKLWLAEGSPSVGERTALRNKRNTISQNLVNRNQLIQSFTGNIDNITSSVSSFTTKEYVLGGNPVQSSSISQFPVTNTYTGSDGLIYKNVTGMPTFSLNSGMAQNNVNILNQAREEFAQSESVILEKIQAVKNSIQSVDSVLYQVQPNYLQLGAAFKELSDSLDNLFVGNADIFRREKTWAVLSRNAFLNKKQNFETQLNIKSNRLNDNQLRTLSIERLKIMYALAGLDNASTNQKVQEFTSTFDGMTLTEKRSMCTRTGMDLWFNINIAGLNSIDSVAPLRIADNANLHENEISALNNAQKIVSNSVDVIYNSKLRLTENLYDLYNRLSFWKKDQPDSIKNNFPSLSLIENQKTFLKNELKVPDISSINVQTTNLGFYNKVFVNWYANHTRGIKETSVGYLSESSASLPQGEELLSIGNTNTFRKVFLQKGNETNTNRTFFLKVRGGAGFTKTRAAQFTTAFSSSGSGVGTTVNTGMLSDNTPPSKPVILFPNYLSTKIVTGNTVYFYYSYDKNKIIAEWLSADAESGISEYQYSVGTAAGQTDILNWISAEGRSEMIIQGLNLEHTKKYYINVKARNGAGLWSQTGSSGSLTIDTTAPSTPPLPTGFDPFGTVGGSMIGQGTNTFPSVNPVVPLPLSLQSGLGSFGGAGSISGGSISIGGNPQNPLYFQSEPGDSAELSWTCGLSNDQESVIYGYEYLITSKNNPSLYMDKWTYVKSFYGNKVKGGILNYIDTFYIDVRAVNHAGLVSDVTRLGSFICFDKTPPNKPEVNLAYSPVAGRAYLIFSEKSFDNETSLAGYQLAIGTTPGGNNIKNWGEIDFTHYSIGNANAYLIPNYNLQQGSYYVSIRAKNGKNMLSSVCTTGPYFVDLTPPVTPMATVTFTGNQYLKKLVVKFTNVSDPESGIEQVEYAVGSSFGSSNVISWTKSVSNTSFTQNLTGSGLNNNTLYYLSVRTKNKAGMYSQVFTTSFRTP